MSARHLSRRDLHYKREICFGLIASLRKSEYRVLNRFMERETTFVQYGFTFRLKLICFLFFFYRNLDLSLRAIIF